jgi:hypothetical protein
MNTTFNASSTWRDLAACRGRPTRYWFDHATAAVAQAVCRACPVCQECLVEALEVEQADTYGRAQGVRGGLTGRDRDRLQASRAPSVAS